VLVPPAVWCPPAGPPRCCVPPCGGRVSRVLPPPAVVGSCPVCWCPPPAVLCDPDRDHCYDRRGATALDASIRSLHGDTRGAATHTPTGYGSCVRRAGTAHAVIHSPQQAFSQQSSGPQWCSSQSQPQPQLCYQHRNTGGWIDRSR